MPPTLAWTQVGDQTHNPSMCSWSGFKPMTFQWMGWCCNHLAALARAVLKLFKQENFYQMYSIRSQAWAEVGTVRKSIPGNLNGKRDSLSPTYLPTWMWILKATPALVGWLSWLENCPIHQKVESFIPSEDTYLGCGFSPRLGYIWQATNRCFFVSLKSTKQTNTPILEWDLK